MHQWRVKRPWQWRRWPTTAHSIWEGDGLPSPLSLSPILPGFCKHGYPFIANRLIALSCFSMHLLDLPASIGPVQVGYYSEELLMPLSLHRLILPADRLQVHCLFYKRLYKDCQPPFYSPSNNLARDDNKHVISRHRASRIFLFFFL